jgi:hypothetical protein
MTGFIESSYICRWKYKSFAGSAVSFSCFHPSLQNKLCASPGNKKSDAFASLFILVGVAG